MLIGEKFLLGDSSFMCFKSRYLHNTYLAGAEEQKLRFFPVINRTFTFLAIDSYFYLVCINLIDLLTYFQNAFKLNRH